MIFDTYSAKSIKQTNNENFKRENSKDKDKALCI
jgi:hypothetical protein